jgi:hypothetical protein
MSDNVLKLCKCCKRTLNQSIFFRKNKFYKVCNDCSDKQSKLKRKCCEHNSCSKLPSFKFKDESHARFCFTHKLLGMISTRSWVCQFQDCNISPIFNVEGEIKAKFCLQHKLPNMIDVTKKTCQYEGCKTIPSYANVGDINAKFCVTHKLYNMVNIRAKFCAHENCSVIGNFCFEDEKTKKYCATHKLPNMVSSGQQCKYNGCKKKPSFNFEGKHPAIMCFEHKENGMINVYSKLCEHPDCKKIPCFNNEGESKAIFCGEHKEQNMVNVVDKRCEHGKCKKRPQFNVEGQTKGRFCLEHKTTDMIDVGHKFCNFSNCKTRVYYGYCGSYPTHCAQHKLDYMITKPKRTCIGNDEEECKEMASYGKSEPLHCEEHSLKDEFCWLIKACKQCCRTDQVLDKEGLCYFICSHEKLHEIHKKQQKIKEMSMIRYLKENLKLPNFVEELPCDKKVEKQDCNAYRPDMPFDCGTHILIIECDEDQHKAYNWEGCASNKSLEHAEEKRMYELMIAYEGKPCIFLRWNPDNFSVKGNACKKFRTEQRLETLKKWVEYCFDVNNFKWDDNLVLYKKLFYDEYSETDLSFQSLSTLEL